MRRFILAWKKQGWEQKFGARIVNYADDFVILCRRNAAEARERMEAIMAKLKLTVNPQKTRVCRVPEESFEFLGYALGRCHSSQTGRSCIGTRVAKKRVKRLCEEISLLTRRTTVGLEAGELVGAINAKLRGWANYFSLGPVCKPTARWIVTRGIGSVDGCALSIRSRGREAKRFPRSISTRGSGSCDWKL